ncbi:MAG: leucine-rich repeat protein [Oscillospiraceae bacterium]|nr:leucine-rich repeat protein [Oscillospiraceae bacterium]
MRKHLLRALLFGAVFAAAIALMTLPASALTEGDWEFQLLDSEVTITGYTGSDEDIVVPSTLAGTPVTAVQYLANSPDDLTARSITFPSSVKSINRILCYAYGSGSDTVTQINLPEGLESIGSHAFENFNALESVTLPSTLKTIGSDAFYSCDALREINFPAGLESLGEDALRYCTSLISADMSKCTALTLESGVFDNCSSLVSAKLPPNADTVTYGCFHYCSSLTDVEIPNSVTRIRDFAFSECTSLASVILPTSLKTLDGNAFSYCSSLVEVTIPYGTESVGGTFMECPNLQALYVPDTVTNLSWKVAVYSDNCVIYCSAGSTAAEVCQSHSLSYLTDSSVNSLITVLYNGKRISFHSYEQNPEIIDNRTLVPLRAIFEAMGADVEWDQSTQTATSTRGGTTVKITIGANEMYKNGSAVAVDVPAQIINNRTMVPVRVIAEAFGADVQWNQNGRTVLITET